MDPNAALARYRELMKDDETEEAAWAAADLVDWIDGGGFLPKDWQGRKVMHDVTVNVSEWASGAHLCAVGGDSDSRLNAIEGKMLLHSLIGMTVVHVEDHADVGITHHHLARS